MLEQLANYINKTIKVNEEELNTILSYFNPLRLQKNELLLTHGQISQRTFFVSKGCLRIFFINEEGQDATRYFAIKDKTDGYCQFCVYKIGNYEPTKRKKNYTNHD